MPSAAAASSSVSPDFTRSRWLWFPMKRNESMNVFTRPSRTAPTA